MRSNNQSRKRVFNLLSNNSDSDDNEDDDASGALFKFDKNPVPIKRVKPPIASAATAKSHDTTDSELFAFSSTSSSQKLASQRTTQPATKANNRLPNQSINRLCKTIVSNMLNMSIQAIPITRTGWMSGKAIKKEEPNVDDESGLLSTKPEDCEGDSKAWIDQIKNPFEVRIKKMHLVNRTTSMISVTHNSTVGGKNFKAFVKVSF